ncbi:prolipoprotein diacylglyceryl transferase, partial [Micrococcus sp. SIMBA_144]
VIFAKVKGLSFWKLTDIAAPSIILGQAIGRWGNFVNQESRVIIGAIDIHLIDDEVSQHQIFKKRTGHLSTMCFLVD